MKHNILSDWGSGEYQIEDCPVCRKGDELHVKENFEYHHWEPDVCYHVRCAQCNIQTIPCADPSEAVEIWNERNKGENNGKQS